MKIIYQTESILLGGSVLPFLMKPAPTNTMLRANFSRGARSCMSPTLTGHETAFIQQKVFSMMPRFFVYMDGVERAEIVKRFTFFFEKYGIGVLTGQSRAFLGA